METVVTLVVIGILYIASFIGITIMVIRDKDPNALVALVTAATTALMGYVNMKSRREEAQDGTVSTTTDPPSDYVEEGI